MKLVIKHKLLIIGAVIGAIGGYAYYYFIGCASGSCAITSNPINSVLYGTFMGGLLFSSSKESKINNSKNEIK